jgi:protein-tyrosine phosphatase
VEGERVEVRREGELRREAIDEATRLTILFVCEGNTCRSPMAEHLCRQLLAARRPPGAGAAAVLSAGMSAVPGTPATAEAQAALREAGLDLTAHRARLLSVRLVELADWIFVMETAQERALVELMPEAAGRIRMLDRFGHNIPDPAGGARAEYRRCRDELEACIREVVAQL